MRTRQWVPRRTPWLTRRSGGTSGQPWRDWPPPTCPVLLPLLTSASSASVFASLGSPTIMEYNSLLLVETVKRLLFLKTNLEHFSSYTPPAPHFPLWRSGLGEAELGV